MVIKINYTSSDVYVSTSVSPVYVVVNYSAVNNGGGAVWGGITGTLSDQTDLQNALDAKFDDPTGTTAQYLRGDGSLATFPTLTGFVPYTGATTNVNLGTHRILAQNATIASNGSGDTFTLNHTSGSGIGLNITKGGNGEGLYINKTSGSGNAATIIGTLNATTLVKSGGTSSQFLKADGSVDGTTYVGGSGVSGQVAYWNGTSSQTGSNNLFWDAANSRLGIGTNAPAARLQVTSDIIVNGVNIGLGGGSQTNNTRVGNLALNNNNLGNANSAFGDRALQNNANGYYNVAIGDRALRLNTQEFSVNNTAIGSQALEYSTSGRSNTAVGQQSMLITNGLYNTAIGDQSGYFGVNANTGGSNNIFIGYQSVGVSATESNRTWIGNSSTTSTWLGGNLLLGGTTNSGQRLQVQGDAFIKGSGATSATIGLQVQNSAGTNLLRVQNSGIVSIGIGPTDTLTTNGQAILKLNSNNKYWTIQNRDNQGLEFYLSSYFGGVPLFVLGDAEFNSSSTVNGLFQRAFAPVAFTGTYTNIELRGTINQTSGANGITRGLYVNQTLTSAADFRAIEWSNNSGWGLYGAGTANNYLGGNLGLGVTPSAWSGLSGKVLEVGTAFGDKAALFQNDIDDLRLMSNVYFDGSFKYVRTGTATIFHSSNGSYKWSNAPSGTAGNAISFTQAMTLTSGGNLLVGTTTDAGFKLDVNGTARVSGLSRFDSTAVFTSIASFATTNGLNLGYSGGIGYIRAVGGTTVEIGGSGSTVTTSNGTLISGLFTANGKATFSGSCVINGSLSGDSGINIGSISNLGYINNYATGGHIVINSNGGNLLVGTTTNDNSALLNLSSTTKGFLPPRMTNAQRTAISSPAVGLMVYCTDTVEGLYVYKSTGWTFVI
jgi:hypothetical protein